MGGYQYYNVECLSDESFQIWKYCDLGAIGVGGGSEIKIISYRPP